MKNIFNLLKFASIILPILNSLELLAQNEKKMKYYQYQNSYSVEPIDGQTKLLEGKEGSILWFDEKYINELFTNVIDESLPWGIRDSLSLGTAFSAAFNLKGDVIHCRLIVNKSDIDRITDNDLFNLYSNLKMIKLDMEKIKVEPYYEYGSNTVNYFRLMGSLISKESRDKFNKTREDKLYKRRQNHLSEDSLTFN